MKERLKDIELDYRDLDERCFYINKELTASNQKIAALEVEKHILRMGLQLLSKHFQGTSPNCECPVCDAIKISEGSGKAAIEALKFYADRNNWLTRPCHEYVGEYFKPVYEEGSKPAIAALKALGIEAAKKDETYR